MSADLFFMSSGTPVYKKESKGPKGFGKNRFVDQDTNLDRPVIVLIAFLPRRKSLNKAEEGFN